MGKSGKQIALLLLIVVLGVAFFRLSDYSKPRVDKIGYSDFIRQVRENRVKTSVIIDGKKISGAVMKGEKLVQYETLIPYADPDLVKTLMSNRVEIRGEESDENFFLKGLFQFLPWLFFFGLIWFLMIRQIQGAGNKAMSFGKSKAKLNAETKNKITFVDVAGVDEAKE